MHKTLQTLLVFDADMLVLPGHTDRPVRFDQVPIAAPLKVIVERVAALGYDEDTFVTWLLKRLPAHPPNYEFIVQLNETGILSAIDPVQLEAGANRCAV